MIESDIRSKFLLGMSKVSCTVSVVTTDGVAGRAGLTVSAMASVSADGDAPTLLICVHHEAPATPLLIKNGCFCTNVLASEQSGIANTFAGLTETAEKDRFGCAEWQLMASGAPRLENPLVAFDCNISSAERVGTHHIFIGEVQDIFVGDDKPALMYGNRAYQIAKHL